MNEMFSCTSSPKQEKNNKQKLQKNKSMKAITKIIWGLGFLVTLGACNHLEMNEVVDTNPSTVQEVKKNNVSQNLVQDDTSNYPLHQLKKEAKELFDRFVQNQYRYIQGELSFDLWAKDYSLSGDSSLQEMKKQIDEMIAYGGRFQSISGSVSLDEYTKKTRKPLTSFEFSQGIWTISGIWTFGEYQLRGEEKHESHNFVGYYIAKIRKENGDWKILSFKAFEAFGPFAEEPISEPVGYWEKSMSAPVTQINMRQARSYDSREKSRKYFFLLFF